MLVVLVQSVSTTVIGGRRHKSGISPHLTLQKVPPLAMEPMGATAQFRKKFTSHISEIWNSHKSEKSDNSHKSEK